MTGTAQNSAMLGVPVSGHDAPEEIKGPLLTIQDVAHLLTVPSSWVRERLRRRALQRIPAFKLGKYWRFQREEVLDWLKTQKA